MGRMSVVDAPARSEAPEEQVRDRADVRRQVRLVVVFALAAAMVLLFRLTTDSFSVTYLLEAQRSADSQPRSLDGSLVNWVALVLALAGVVLAALNRVPRGGLGLLLYVLVGLSFYVAFMAWAFADQGEGFQASISNPIPGTISIATPLVLGALAGVVCERAGVINIAIEGQFLAGAFSASLFASIALSSLAFIPLWLCAPFGLLGGALAGMLVSAILGLFALRYQVNQVVLGVVIVAFATGLTGFLLGQIPSESTGRLNNPDPLEPLAVPVLSGIPVIGQALFEQTILVYLTYAAVVVVALLLFQTRWGLRVRAVGEHPKAADTVGIKVNRLRWQAVLFGGLLAGLGGAYYTVGSSGAFDKEMSAGTGFIALAAVIMGRWHPVWAALAAVFFGFMRNLGTQLSLVDRIPGDLIGALPYLATVIVVAGFVGRVRPPAADGEPFVKA